MSANATELWLEMDSAIRRCGHTRQVTGTTPAPQLMYEADIGRTYVWRHTQHNLISCAPIRLPWAVANAVHFFADTEVAPLRQYNPLADRFAPDGFWRGAYGPIAMPQIRKCIELLMQDRHTRRAIVSMGGYCDDPDLNRPSCWSFLQFISSRHGLDLCVYQRSLSMKVMPYDAVVLSCILAHVCQSAAFIPGQIHWTVGSLHTPELVDAHEIAPRVRGISLPLSLTAYPGDCLLALQHPEDYHGEWATELGRIAK